MTGMRLSLIVLRSADAKRLSSFYAKLGIKMVQEKHGTGPLHFSGALESGVIETYPTKAPTKITFGLMVKSVETFTSDWIAGGGSTSASGLLIDPDAT